MKAAAPRIWSDDQLLRLHGDGRRHELWRGKVVTMSPAGGGHGNIIMRLGSVLTQHVERHRLGATFDGQTGFRLSVDFCFSPDLAFVSKQRLKLVLPDTSKLIHGAPDLAVEVLSPSDSITKTELKLQRFMAHGTKLAWLVDPCHFSVRVYREPEHFELLRAGQFLTGNSVLPGFRYSVARLFQDPLFS
jgi:Uma2 family endonuclease